MIAAILQPYFFPYIGYFQLMDAVDTFIYFDDVQYIERGWVNRNRIRSGDEGIWLTMPVVNAPRDFSIRERRYVLDGAILKRLTRTLSTNYQRGSGFADNWPMVCSLLAHPDANVAAYNCHLLSKLANVFGIDTKLLCSSQLGDTGTLKGEQRIIELCRRIGASHYVNPIGGRSLYDEGRFEAAGLRLSFLRTRVPPVNLRDIPQHLAILDNLLRHGVMHTRELLPDYDLLTPSEANA